MLDDLYDAAAFPEHWPDVLHRLALLHGARGALVFRAPGASRPFALSSAVEPLFDRYFVEGWMEKNERGAPMIREHAPQFRTDSDFRDAAAMEAMPVYRDLLTPMGFAFGAGTVIQGPGNDMIVLTIEGFADDAATRRALPQLDLLRSHIARAIGLATRMAQAQSAAAVDALEISGAPAAIVGPEGNLRAMNESFERRMGNICANIGGRLRFRSTAMAARIDDAIVVARAGGRPAATVVVPRDGDHHPCALHVIPIRHTARDRFDSDGILLMLANPRNNVVPQAGLLRLLFDLTPAEALLTIELVSGHSLRAAAERRGVRYSTARAQLRSVFVKTDCHRQSELVRLLCNGLTDAIRVD